METEYIATPVEHSHNRRQFKELSMRQFITMGIALAVITVASAHADAGKAAKPCPHCGRYHNVQSYGYSQTKKQSVFSKMWEAEQRKNAWLKRTFLGR
jgi:hypothetical protein